MIHKFATDLAPNMRDHQLHTQDNWYLRWYLDGGGYITVIFRFEPDADWDDALERAVDCSTWQPELRCDSRGMALLWPRPPKILADLMAETQIGEIRDWLTEYKGELETLGGLK
jgi:hypothetical protein